MSKYIYIYIYICVCVCILRDNPVIPMIHGRYWWLLLSSAMHIQAWHRSPMETRWIKKSLPKGPASHGNYGKYQSHNNCLQLLCIHHYEKSSLIGQPFHQTPPPAHYRCPETSRNNAGSTPCVPRILGHKLVRFPPRSGFVARVHLPGDCMSASMGL